MDLSCTFRDASTNREFLDTCVTSTSFSLFRTTHICPSRVKNESRRESCTGFDPRLLVRLFGAKSLAKSLAETLSLRLLMRFLARLSVRLFAPNSLAKSLAESLGSDPMHDSRRDSFFYAGSFENFLRDSDIVYYYI